MRLAIVGAGWTGRRQAEAVEELSSDLETTVVMDTDGEAASRVAHEFGIPNATSHFDAVLSDPTVDAVSICTPHAMHREQAIAAARAGKHVLVTKPIALRVDDARDMIQEARTAGVTLYVHEEEVYTPQATWLHDVVKNRTHVGDVVAASFRFGFRSDVFRYPGRREWLTRPEMGGTGTWMLHGIHSMAKLRHVFGEAESVYLREHHAPDFATPEIEGTVSGIVRFRSGICVSVLHTCESQLRGPFEGVTLYGSAGVVHAGADGYRVEVFSKGGANVEHATYPDLGATSHALVMRAFVECVAGDTTGPTSAASEARSLAVVEAGYESIRSGEVVAVTQVET